MRVASHYYIKTKITFKNLNMTNIEFSKVESMLRLFKEYKTWTKIKRDILKQVVKYAESGTHEYFTSNCWTQKLAYNGDYYTENKNHNRRGTLKKYRGKKVFVMCVGHGSYFTRGYIIAVIE